MKRLLILILTICWTANGQSQIVGFKIEKYIAEKSINTFLVYSFVCSGDSLPFDSCQYDEPHFLFWKQDTNFYLKRFEYCKTYKTLSLDTSNPLAYYLQNKAVIDTEEIKLPTHFDIKKRRNIVDSLITTSSASHSCYYKFQLPSKKEPEYKYASTYDLDFKAFDNGKENAYYSYNQNTKFKTLIDLTTILIRELNQTKRFEPE